MAKSGNHWSVGLHSFSWTLHIERSGMAKSDNQGAWASIPSFGLNLYHFGMKSARDHIPPPPPPLPHTHTLCRRCGETVMGSQNRHDITSLVLVIVFPMVV